MRFITTEGILSNKGEFFDENWLNLQKPYVPKVSPFKTDIVRQMRVEDVDIWEIIVQNGGGVGVYAAFVPYDEYYIFTEYGKVTAEFGGPNANARLEQHLISKGIPYPKDHT